MGPSFFVPLLPGGIKKPPHEREKPSWKLTSLTKTQKGTTKVELFSEIMGCKTGNSSYGTPVENEKSKKHNLKISKCTTMKTMQNFAAQQLSKTQMNLVHGGAGITECVGMKYNVELEYIDAHGNTRRAYGCGNTEQAALLSGYADVRYTSGYTDVEIRWY